MMTIDKDAQRAAALAEEAAAYAAYEARTEATADGRTIAELRTAFDKVQNSENWKLPIDREVGVLDPAERRVIAQAIEFFTGSKAEWSSYRMPRAPKLEWRVRAVGYYAAIGA